MARGSELSLWMTLVTVALLVIAQAVAGFNRPVNIVLGCASAALGIWAAATLVARRNGRGPARRR